MELSPREVEVFVLIANGFTDKEIANTLKLSPKTIQTYVTRSCLKLQARNRTHAVTKLLWKSIHS